MAQTEKQVEVAFVAYLVEGGWEVTTLNDEHSDLIAKRGAEVLVAELKGHTKSAGTAMDIGYGQLLRRMNPDHKAWHYALVVPETLRWHVERVRADVRASVGITVFLVDQNDQVHVL
jgi:predicted RNA methylase